MRRFSGSHSNESAANGDVVREGQLSRRVARQYQSAKGQLGDGLAARAVVAARCVLDDDERACTRALVFQIGTDDVRRKRYRRTAALVI